MTRRLFSLTDLTLSAEGRGRFAVPDFAVWAASVDEAVSVASRIVLCDRRTSDGILWTLEGSVGVDSDDVSQFSIQMKPE